MRSLNFYRLERKSAQSSSVHKLPDAGGITQRECPKVTRCDGGADMAGQGSPMGCKNHRMLGSQTVFYTPKVANKKGKPG